MNRETYEASKSETRSARAESSARAERRRSNERDPELDFRPAPNRASRRRLKKLLRVVR